MQIQASQRNAYKDNLRGALEKVKPSTINLELNRGCSNGCWFCCYSAKKGADRPIPFDLIEDTREVVSTDPNKPGTIAMHLRSDPLDYHADGKTAIDVYRTMKSIGSRLDIILITAVPKGSEQILQEMIKQGIKFDLTFFQENEERLLRIPGIAEELRAYQITKTTASVSFATVDHHKIERMEKEMKETFEKIGNGRITYDELRIDFRFHNLLKKFMAESTHKQGVFTTPLEGNTIVPIFGSYNGAFIFSEFVSDQEIKKLILVKNLAQFSRLVNSGRLKPGDPFLIEFWGRPGANANFFSEMRFKAVFRDWRIATAGRVFQRNFDHEYNSGQGPTIPTILITSDGAMHSVRSVRPREENKEGLVIEQISGPVY